MPITLTADARKRLTASGFFGLRETVALTASPAAEVAGTCTLTLTFYGQAFAECELTDGAGSLDLSTAEAVAAFVGYPVIFRHAVDAELWNVTTATSVGKGRLYVENRSESVGASQRIAAAGELELTLSETLPAGTPVMLGDDGEAESCRAANAKRLLGILRSGAESGQKAKVVTAGIVSVPLWGLTAGVWYYLSTGADALTATAPEGYNVRPVGIAVDASTLALIPGTTVQHAAGTPHYLTWDPLNQRLLSVAPVAATAGAASAGAIPCLDSGGQLDPAMIPAASAAAAIAAHRAQFSALAPLEDPTGPDTVALINALLSILQTGAVQ